MISKIRHIKLKKIKYIQYSKFLLLFLISSGNFHDQWFIELKKNDFIDELTGKKINEETIKLLELQKDSMVKFLMKIPKLYYTKSHFPLEISQRAFDHLWRVCESYEMWCKETKQDKLIKLDLLD